MTVVDFPSNPTSLPPSFPSILRTPPQQSSTFSPLPVRDSSKKRVRFNSQANQEFRIPYVKCKRSVSDFSAHQKAKKKSMASKARETRKHRDKWNKIFATWDLPLFNHFTALQDEVKDFGCQCSRSALKILSQAVHLRNKIAKKSPEFVQDPDVFPKFTSISKIKEEIQQFYATEVCQNLVYVIPEADLQRISEHKKSIKNSTS